MKIEDMNKDERSLLLYFECQAVDYGGKIDARRMNGIDFEIAKRWNEEGFVRFGRIYSGDIAHNFDHWCVLSEAAWTEAHRERRARNVRVERALNVHRNGIDDVIDVDIPVVKGTTPAPAVEF
jgi:hypothetical protein